MKSTSNYNGTSGSLTDKVAPTEEGIQQSLPKSPAAKQQVADDGNTNGDLLQKNLQTEAATTKSQNVFAALDTVAKKS